MAIQHHTRHVDVQGSGNDLIGRSAQRALEAAIVEIWVLKYSLRESEITTVLYMDNNSYIHACTVYMYSDNHATYSIGRTELDPVTLLPAAMADVVRRWRVLLQGSQRRSFGRSHIHIPWWAFIGNSHVIIIKNLWHQYVHHVNTDHQWDVRMLHRHHTVLTHPYIITCKHMLSTCYMIASRIIFAIYTHRMGRYTSVQNAKPLHTHTATHKPLAISFFPLYITTQNQSWVDIVVLYLDGS